jgi:hypothetical protein
MERFLIVLNFTHEPRTFEHGDLHGRIVLTTALDRNSEPVAEIVRLRSDEGVVVEIEQHV